MTMNETDSKNQISKHLKGMNSKHNTHFLNTMTMRLLVIVALLFLSIIPVKMLNNFIDIRISEQQKTVAELADQWGNEQTIIGPILSIPYVERISRIESQTDSKGVKSSVSKDIFNSKTLMLLPENLSITAKLKDKKLQSGKKQTSVFQANVELSGNFNLESLPEASGYNTIEWDKAVLAVGLTNNSSVEAGMPLRWGSSSTALKPGTELMKYIQKGLHANLEAVANENTSPKFKLQLDIKGSKHLFFAPLGELTSINVSTDSNDSIIHGKVSPSSKISSAEGLEATWRISNLNRNYPQQWFIEDNGSDKNKQAIEYDFSELLAGLEFDSKNNSLTKVKISVKYLGLILGVVFLSLFILEYKRGSRPKPNLGHYLVVSLPILLVPILLLTLNEIVVFTEAYQIAAGTSIALIVFYVLSSLKSFSKGFYILLILASLYATIFIAIEMPELTLAASSAASLVIIAVLMLTSLNTSEYLKR